MAALFKRGRNLAARMGIVPGEYSQLLGRTHQNVVVVALANKSVRMAWAVLCKNERYRTPVLAVSV